MISKVLFVTNEYPPEKIAGTAMSTQFLATELVERGYDVTVVVTSRSTAQKAEVDGRLRIIRLRPLRLPLTRMAQRAALLTRLARDMQPDIIQGQSLSCGALAVAAGRAAHVPAVVYVQGLDLYQSSAWARRSYIKWALSRADAVAAVTDDLRRRAMAVSARNVAVIPHGLQRRRAHGLDRTTARAAERLPADRKIILYAGRLIALKGIPHLIDAFPRVLAVHPDAVLIIVGDGNIRSSLAERVRARRLDETVIFAGERPHETVIRFMRAADIFVLPSLIESFGLVLVEAMSCGLPIVASDVMGIPSVVQDGVNGYLVPPASPEALGAKISALLAHPELRDAMGRRNLAQAEQYALPRIADRFADLWQRTRDGWRKSHG